MAWKDLLSVVPRISDQFHPRCCSFIMQFLVERIPQCIDHERTIIATIENAAAI